MQSAYSWCGSRLHFVLEDDVAAAYNRYQQAFLQGQLDHEDRTGSPWTPNDPLAIGCTDEETAAYNSIADLINLLVDINGGSIHITNQECTSDFLVKL